MKRFIMLLMTLGILVACEQSEVNNDREREAEQARLAEMRQEILDRIDAVPCDNHEDWRPEAMGSKPCGGPWEYVTYPHGADESGEILTLIRAYTEQQAEYNEKYGINSDCAVIPEPDDVICVDGKPVFADDEGLNPPIIEQ